MKVRLIDAEGYMELSLPLDETAELALSQQIHRALREPDTSQFRDRFRNIFSTVVLASLDWDLQSPTSNQLAFAMAISKEIGVDLPADALRHKGAMADFLNRFSDLYKSRRQARRTRGGLTSEH